MNLKMICPLASIHEKLQKSAFRPRRLCSYLNLFLNWQYLKDTVIFSLLYFILFKSNKCYFIQIHRFCYWLEFNFGYCHILYPNICCYTTMQTCLFLPVCHSCYSPTWQFISDTRLYQTMKLEVIYLTQK